MNFLSTGKIEREVGERLRVTRLAVRLRQADMARALEIKKSTYAMQEAGANMLPPKTALRLCALFDVTMDWLYRGRLDAMPQEMREKVRKVLASNVVDQAPEK